MKVIIAGSRNINLSLAEIDNAVNISKYKVTEVVSGGQRGIDQCCEFWAIAKGLPFKIFHMEALGKPIFLYKI